VTVPADTFLRKWLLADPLQYKYKGARLRERLFSYPCDETKKYDILPLRNGAFFIADFIRTTLIAGSSNGKQSFLSSLARKWKSELFRFLARSTGGHMPLEHVIGALKVWETFKGGCRDFATEGRQSIIQPEQIL